MCMQPFPYFFSFCFNKLAYLKLLVVFHFILSLVPVGRRKLERLRGGAGTQPSSSHYNILQKSDCIWMWGTQPNSLPRSQLLLYVDFITPPSWMEAYLQAHVLSSSLPSHCISSLFLHHSYSLQVKVSSFTKLCASLHWRHAKPGFFFLCTA